MKRQMIAILLIASGQPNLVVAAEPLIRRARTRPATEVGIPAREYQFQSRSRSLTAISRTALLVPPAPGNIEPATELVPPGYRLEERNTRETTIPIHDSLTSETGTEKRVRELIGQIDRWNDRQIVQSEPMRLFVLEEPQLEIDHCSISQVAVQLHPEGHWVLSLRGDQNRHPGEPQAIEFNPRLHIRRNEFIIHLRCLANFSEAPSETAIVAGKPIVADLGPVRFWVENGQPRYLRHVAHDRQVKAMFQAIDRVEVEFFYR